MKIIASTLLVLVLCFLFTGLGCLSARQQATGSHGDPLRGAPPQAPENLRVPDGQTVLLKAHAKGVQIYYCMATAADPGKFDWSFKAPEADLTNEGGKKIAKHYAGPTWEANDGSKVVGAVQQKTDAPRPGAVPWLLLKAKTNEGIGTFAKVTYIQRVDTEGGLAPAAGCDKAHVNTEERVDYKANYYLYTPQP